MRKFPSIFPLAMISLLFPLLSHTATSGDDSQESPSQSRPMHSGPSIEEQLEALRVQLATQQEQISQQATKLAEQEAELERRRTEESQRHQKANAKPTQPKQKEKTLEEKVRHERRRVEKQIEGVVKRLFS